MLRVESADLSSRPEPTLQELARRGGHIECSLVAEKKTAAKRFPNGDSFPAFLPFFASLTFLQPRSSRGLPARTPGRPQAQLSPCPTPSWSRLAHGCPEKEVSQAQQVHVITADATYRLAYERLPTIGFKEHVLIGYRKCLSLKARFHHLLLPVQVPF